MSEIIQQVLPWVIIGIAVVLYAVQYKKRAQEKNYLTKGLACGLGFGTAICGSGIFHPVMIVGMGMLIGEVIGLNIKRRG